MQARSLSFVHQFVPGAGTNAASTLLLLHGTGGSETDLLPLGPQVLPGAAILSPRGKVLERGMPRFFRRLAEGVFDVEDVKLRAAELADFIAEACVAYQLDAARIIAIGYSNGANIASATMLVRPGAIRAAALIRPMVPFTPSPMPSLAGARVLIAGGARDPIATPAEVSKLGALLTSAGVDVTSFTHPGGHELGHGDIAAVREWIKAAL